MTKHRQEERRLTNDTAYRSYHAGDGSAYAAGGGAHGIAPGGVAAVGGHAAAGSRRMRAGAQHIVGGYADRRYGVGISAGVADRLGSKGRAAEDAAGELRRRRNVSRAPDMSKPRARRAAPSVSLGNLSKTKTQTAASAKAEPRIYTIPKAEYKPFPIAFIFTALMCSTLFMYMIYNIVRINEYTIAISELKSRYNQLVTEQSELMLKLEKKNDLVEIERIATEQYGMVKRDKVAKQYVNVGEGDVIEVETEAEAETSSDGLSSLMSAISANFGDLLD
ncbi:MAG TPA: hypothetical protein PK778_08530 [Bacillota bacterium]|nr:hypothetical protein [Clostridiales bacterium]HPT86019.1 hypothetical protein [Bacillota bacterium]